MPLILSSVFFLLLLGQLTQLAFADEGRLIYPSRVGEPVILELSSLKSSTPKIDSSELLQVFVGKQDACCSNRTPIAGQYEEADGLLKFQPAFEFIEGQDYVARIMQVGLESASSHTLFEFSIQSDAVPVPALVTSIYPSGDSLPENVLRFYIHFSKPMKPHVAFEYIKLVDATGRVDEAAFMRFKQELWSEDRRRLTLLMDPGRIKRNVSTNLRLGPALRQGRQYSLVVEEGWPSANGDQVLKRFVKTFEVSAALRELPDASQWDISAPARGSNAALVIAFDRPFDHQLLHTDINVVSESGIEIPGHFVIENNETSLRFSPDSAWVGDRIRIVVDSELEDVAGNNFRDLLDHSVEIRTKQIRSTSKVIDLRPESGVSNYVAQF